MFSVGYSLKDKLPNKETVEFFDKSGFNVLSTNNVFGIGQYFNTVNQIKNNPKSSLLNSFSSLKQVNNKNTMNKRFNGEKKFQFF